MKSELKSCIVGIVIGSILISIPFWLSSEMGTLNVVSETARDMAYEKMVGAAYFPTAPLVTIFLIGLVCASIAYAWARKRALR